MSKKSKIRWSSDDRELITKRVRVFNAKITRTLKKNPEWVDYLPEKINVKSFSESILTRADLNRQINSLDRFMEKNAEMVVSTKQGITTTKWEKKEYGIKVGIINRARTLEIKKADVSTYKGTMGSIENNNLLPLKYNIDKIESKAWDKFRANVDKQVKSSFQENKEKQYKINYLVAIKEYLSNGKRYAELEELVTSLSPSFIYRKYYDDPILQLHFVYDPQEVNFIIETTIEHWVSALNLF